MRITKQISGNASSRDDNQSQGRGEYEWADLLPGVDPTREELLNRRVLLRLTDAIALDTACEFEHQGHKWRIRTAEDARATHYVYPIYHIAVALLMPSPTRQEQSMGRGLPVLRHEEYILCDIIGGAIALPSAGIAEMAVPTIIVANHTVPRGEAINVAERFASVQRVWECAEQFPEELAAMIRDHAGLVRGGDQISITGRRLVERIQRATAELSREFEVTWATLTSDPLPALLSLIELNIEEPAPTPIEEIPPELFEIRRREIARQRRLAAARGGESGRFRREVRAAYRSTCIVCGLCLPQLWEGGRAGVDSAHILPDSEFDLNHVTNGLCLCKLHHWAFDEGIIEVRFDDATGYSIAIPEEARTRAAGPPVRLNLAFLQPFLGPVPEGRLPADPSAWPDPRCLLRLHELLFG